MQSFILYNYNICLDHYFLQMKDYELFNLNVLLVAFEQWEFFNMPQQLWHWPTLYFLSSTSTRYTKTVAKRLAVQMPLPALTI